MIQPEQESPDSSSEPLIDRRQAFARRLKETQELLNKQLPHNHEVVETSQGYCYIFECWATDDDRVDFFLYPLEDFVQLLTSYYVMNDMTVVVCSNQQVQIPTFNELHLFLQQCALHHGYESFAQKAMSFLWNYTFHLYYNGRSENQNTLGLFLGEDVFQYVGEDQLFRLLVGKLQVAAHHVISCQSKKGHNISTVRMHTAEIRLSIEEVTQLYATLLDMRGELLSYWLRDDEDDDVFGAATDAMMPLSPTSSISV